MLRLADDWQFEVDVERSRLWLRPQGSWGFELRCKRTSVRTAEGLTQAYAPELRIESLLFDGFSWRELAGQEELQHGPWDGEAEPLARLTIIEPGELYDAHVRVVAVRGTSVEIAVDAKADVFLDEGHDKKVPLEVRAILPFEGVTFRYRATGLAGRDPEGHAIELLRPHLDPMGFAEPETERLEPGLYLARFHPVAEDRSEDDELDDASPEELALLSSGRELLEGMLAQGWIELEGDGLDSLVAPFVAVLEEGGRGPKRAERVVEWLLERDEVAEFHASDEDLGRVLDKFWG
ncbi:MAG: hypothetical protein AAGH15_09315 [Myxococcota bacterium]